MNYKEREFWKNKGEHTKDSRSADVSPTQGKAQERVRIHLEKQKEKTFLKSTASN